MVVLAAATVAHLWQVVAVMCVGGVDVVTVAVPSSLLSCVAAVVVVVSRTMSRETPAAPASPMVVVVGVTGVEHHADVPVAAPVVGTQRMSYGAPVCTGGRCC